METLTKQVREFGTGAAVIVPKNWIGAQVEVSLKETPWKDELMELLFQHLDKIEGVYLLGSYARQEQGPDSDIDILIVTSEKIKLSSKRFHFIVMLPETLNKKTFLNLFFYAAIHEAKPIFNSTLLRELKEKATPSVKEVKDYLDFTKSAINIIDSFIDLDRIGKSKEFTSPGIIYSIILRARGLFILKNLARNKPFGYKELIKEVTKEGINRKTFETFYRIYQKDKQDQKIGKAKIKLEEAEKFLALLEKWYGQRSKEQKLWKKE